MLHEIKQFSNKDSFDHFVLGGDIGGTNTNLAVAGIRKSKPELLFSLHYKTERLKNLEAAVKHCLDYINYTKGIKINKACFAVAGIIKDNHIALTQNIRWNVYCKKIKQKTKLKNIYLINDFEAVGRGISCIPEKSLKIIQKGKPEKDKAKAVIGVGTGLGKTILYFDKNRKSYLSLPSEGGFSDFPAQTKEDIELLDFIKKKKKTNKVIYEDLLSGRGIEIIYNFLKKKFSATKITKEIDNSTEKPTLISKYRNKDKICKKTFDIFSKAYAIAARNFALDTLCFSGLYITGGIAIKNKDIFGKEFRKEFRNNPKLKKALKEIPIYLIKDYNVSLYGSILCASEL